MNTILAYIIISYPIIASLYGWYSMLMQRIRHPYHTESWRMLTVFFGNMILMPFSITYAIVNKTLIDKNLILALKDQGPFKRAFRNLFITGNAWGLFHINSHVNQAKGTDKVKYNTKKTAIKSAEAMSKKTGKHFSTYKCAFCDGYHIGKNRDNK